MLVSDPPLLLWLLLVCLPTSLWSCLHCDKNFKTNLAKLRAEVVERQIHDTRLKARASLLLRGLEEDFFLHYATSQFSGFAVKAKVDDLIKKVRSKTGGLLQTSLKDQALLEELVAFRKETTMKLKVALKEHQTQACDPKTCVWLRYKVFDCRYCQETSAVCLTQSQCFVDSQDRVSLRYGAPLQEPNIARNGVAIVLSMGALLFLVIIGVIITYWRNRMFEYV
ncbi:izumo sperm-egg fusion protein 2 [Hemicordylus capensis]|uniref:izumo sperm-egg fusion protein 2 n=1 Tax=Hemicordylus capensis TaxID=884348 RepID=UPI00230215B0|nr:izumo sperm-egg fusion protein 2 [Hemicordylus capensis]